MHFAVSLLLLSISLPHVASINIHNIIDIYIYIYINYIHICVCVYLPVDSLVGSSFSPEILCTDSSGLLSPLVATQALFYCLDVDGHGRLSRRNVAFIDDWARPGEETCEELLGDGWRSWKISLQDSVILLGPFSW